MSDEIQGGYPGGPRRFGDEPKPGDKDGANLRGVEDRERGKQVRQVRREEKRRRSNVRVVVGIAVVIGVAAGAYVGLQSVQTAEEMAAMERAIQEAETSLDSQARKIMDELWKMEAAEAARGRGPGG